MPPELILVLVGVVWATAGLLAISLARAAKAGDIALNAGHQERARPDARRAGQLRAQIEQEAPWLDLRAHPRPTRRPSAPEPALPAVSASDQTAWPTLSIAEAAQALKVTPEVLLAWEERYGFPRSCRWTTERGCTYSRREVLALSEALERDLSISSAMAAARTDTTRQRATARKAHLGRHPARGST